MSTPHTTTPDEDAMALGMELARGNAPAFVYIGHDMSAPQRIDFIRALFCTLAGMAEQSVGYEASRDVLRFVATLPPAGNVGALQ